MHVKDKFAHPALFLDLDGTLIDIAPTPSGVIIPRELVGLLQRVTHSVNGALAIVTGRPIADVDRYLAPLAPVAAGGHGAEIRTVPRGSVEVRTDPIADVIVGAVQDLVRRQPGTLFELKKCSVAIHYRQSPASEPTIEAALREILVKGPDHLILCRGRKVFEIVPSQISKGAALEAFMSLPVFKGRQPVMIGDDVSDVSAFEAATRLGGSGLKVAGEQFSAAEADFAGTADVRAWLTSLADRLLR